MTDKPRSGNSSDAGSYRFGDFKANETELERLKRQASVTTELELSILARIGLTKGMNVLDLACGPGLVSCELAKAAGPGQVTGVDISADLIADARKNQKQAGIENITFQQGNVYELDLPENAFDFVYARFLFQHLERPLDALENVLRVLKPSGILCAVDVDDDWLTLYPASSEFKHFTQKAGEGQRAQGGDRRIGHKLGGYYHSAGFENVRTDIQVITSQDVGMPTFLNLTTSFKLEQIPQAFREEGTALFQIINSITEQPYHWGAVGVFIVTGQKPAV